MNWRLPKHREQDLHRKLRADLELERAEQEDRGLTAEAARFATQRSLGNVGLIRETTREAGAAGR